jgi:MoaA/NifB/PqqE/SkfB family radical SAM enzyme
MQILRTIWRLIPFHKRSALLHSLQNRWVWRKTGLRFLSLNSKCGLAIEITDKCNLKCRYCLKSINAGAKGGHIDFERLTKILADESLSKYGDIALGGLGEPTLYPQLLDAICLTRQYAPNAKISIATNGTLLNYKFGKQLVKSGLSEIAISINASSAEQYARINAANLYEKVTQNTKDFLKAVNEENATLKVVLRVLGGDINKESQIKTFRNYWKPHMGKNVSITVTPLSNRAGYINMNAIEEQERLKRGERKVERQESDSGAMRKYTSQNRYPCAALLNLHTISKDGEAKACCTAPMGVTDNLSLGNTNQESLSHLYFGDKATKLRRQNLNCAIYELIPCNTCSYWRSFPNIWWRNPLYPLFGTKWF